MTGAGGPEPPRRSWSGLRSRGDRGGQRVTLPFGLGTIFEAPAFVSGLDDIAVMRKTVQHGGGHLGVPKHLGPVGKGQVGGDDDRCVFVELADQMEQQLAARLAEGQIAELVDDNEIMTQEGLDQASTSAGSLFLFELIDEIDEVEEAATRAGRITAAAMAMARCVFPCLFHRPE